MKIRINRMYVIHPKTGDYSAVTVTIHTYDAKGKHVLSKKVKGKIGSAEAADYGYVIDVGGLRAVKFAMSSDHPYAVCEAEPVP